MASSNPQQFTGKAIVSYDDLEKGGWKMEEVTTRALQDNELVVEMVASGICHTDILCGGENAGPLGFYPRVLGHEGVFDCTLWMSGSNTYQVPATYVR